MSGSGTSGTAIETVRSDVVIRTLIVEDDALTAEVHALYLSRVKGFELVGIARTASAALSAFREAPAPGYPRRVDLILLDLNLPDGHGVEVARRLRSAGVSVDIIAITAVREIEVVHTAVSVGIVQYLIKPFTFAVFRERLEQYRDYRSQLESSGSAATQSEVDGMLATLRPRGRVALPKGLSAPTLETVVQYLKGRADAVSSVEVAESILLSRVTARRYLEHLVGIGQAVRSPRYGNPGRPEYEYHWIR